MPPSDQSVAPSATVCGTRLDLGKLDVHGELPESLRTAALRILAACVDGWQCFRDCSTCSPSSKGSSGNSTTFSVKGTSPGCPASPVSLCKFHMHTLTGGMSNVVFKCEKGGAVNSKVLLRCYGGGGGGDAFLDRKAEMAAFRYLAQAGLGPRLLGEFANGRVEEFLEAETLTPVQMREPRMSAAIARKVAALHALRPPGLDAAPQLWRTLRRWHALARGGSGGGVPHAADAFDGMARLGECVEELERRLAATPSPTVFAHNDLQYGNLMFAEGGEEDASGGSGGGTLYLIDYEYSCYAPRGFDLGNHFCEWCADYRGAAPHALDWARFPSDAQQRAFCAAYLGAAAGAAEGARGGGGDDAAVRALVHEAREYALASHLLWACWGLAQARVSEIAFDYVGYAHGRLDAYLHFSRVWPAPEGVRVAAAGGAR
ncbi:choline/ethanolamine kinase [Tribonema minus]|uniref:Choline/ethanolamine kinase n=1 Tax=Tribonema minus TaxID=303371 RepID=A0A836CHX7_9STRA|nr:choline/ethanolamine kinase [Tribonema minus]